MSNALNKISREQLRTIDPHNLENEEVVALADAYHHLMYWKALPPLFEEMDLLEFGLQEFLLVMETTVLCSQHMLTWSAMTMAADSPVSSA